MKSKVTSKIEPMSRAEFRSIRTEFKKSQHDLGLDIGVSQQAIALWEKDERKIPKTVARLLRLLKKYPQLLNEF